MIFQVIPTKFTMEDNCKLGIKGIEPFEFDNID